MIDDVIWYIYSEILVFSSKMQNLRVVGAIKVQNLTT